MANSKISEVIQHFCRAVLQDSVGMTDGQLLHCFLTQRDDAAFAALVRRHSPMVWGVCRRVLPNYHDAEDAFQATFLVLVHKAASVEPKEMVANWLYGVAYQTALKARATAAKRKERERQVVEMPEPAVEEREVWHDLRLVLDQELSRLPDKYRVPIVLCDLEGKTRKEAAQQLGWPEGTVAWRLATARKLLAKRLARHGLAVSVGSVAAVLSQKAASAGVPTSVVSSTVRVAMLVADGQVAASGLISVKVAALTEGAMKAMFVTKLKVATAVLLVAVASVGSGSYLCRTQAAKQGHPGEQPTTPVAVAEKNTQAEKKPKEDKALAELQSAKDELTAAKIQLRVLTKRYERLKEAYEKEEAKAVWTLDFRLNKLRVVLVDGQPQGQGRKTVWYCRYEVSNPTDEARTFIPGLELIAADEVYHDTVLPRMQEAVRRIEDPEQILDMKNSVTMANNPIPPAKQAADQKKAVVGLALWEGADSDAKSMTLFVSGLSNDWSCNGDTIRRKMLKLSLKRVNNEMRPTGPAEWVYRTTKLREEDNTNDQQAEIELKSWKKDWQVVAMAQDGAMAYINLGSSDGIMPRVTFSIHSRSLDSKENPAKGTLEVVRAIGPHLSQARVTSVKKPKSDPIRKGDQLFNPTRNPGKNIEEMSGMAKDKEGEERRWVIEGLIKWRAVDRDAQENKRRHEIEQAKQAIAAAEKRDKEWQKQREHLQAVVNELERQLKVGDAADLNRRVEQEVLNKRLKTLEMLKPSPAHKDNP